MNFINGQENRLLGEKNKGNGGEWLDPQDRGYCTGKRLSPKTLCAPSNAAFPAVPRLPVTSARPPGSRRLGNVLRPTLFTTPTAFGRQGLAGLRLAHLSFIVWGSWKGEALEFLFEFVARRVREVRNGAGRLAAAGNLGGERPWGENDEKGGWWWRGTQSSRPPRDRGLQPGCFPGLSRSSGRPFAASTIFYLSFSWHLSDCTPACLLLPLKEGSPWRYLLLSQTLSPQFPSLPRSNTSSDVLYTYPKYIVTLTDPFIIIFSIPSPTLAETLYRPLAVCKNASGEPRWASHIAQTGSRTFSIKKEVAAVLLFPPGP